eukprot:1160012-Pelagomonas_calceolata.AAC.6
MDVQQITCLCMSSLLLLVVSNLRMLAAWLPPQHTHFANGNVKSNAFREVASSTTGLFCYKTWLFIHPVKSNIFQVFIPVLYVVVLMSMSLHQPNPARQDPVLCQWVVGCPRTRLPSPGSAAFIVHTGHGIKPSTWQPKPNRVPSSAVAASTAAAVPQFVERGDAQPSWRHRRWACWIRLTPAWFLF